MLFIRTLSFVLDTLQQGSMTPDSLVAADSSSMRLSDPMETSVHLYALLTIFIAVLVYGLFKIFFHISSIKNPDKTRDAGMYLFIVRAMLILLLFYMLIFQIYRLPDTVKLIITVSLVVLIVLSAFEPLRNAISGLIMITGRCLRPGDIIRIGIHEGKVESRRAFRVELSEESGHRIYIPNRLFFSESFINKSAGLQVFPVEFIMNINVPVDFAQFRDLVKETVISFPYTAPGKKVTVMFRPGHGGQKLIMVRAFILESGYRNEFVSFMTENLTTFLNNKTGK